MSAGHVSSGRTDSTASWLDPESNQTSRMFISRSKRRAAALRARQPGGDELLGRPLVPRIGAVVVEHRRGLLDQRRRGDRLAALRAVDRRNRHAPGALARDAPVGPVRDHVVHAVVAPRRDPAHLVVDRVDRRFAQRLASRRQSLEPSARGPSDFSRFAVQRDEPLRRGQKDHRVVAAPAVRVLMRERFAVPQAGRVPSAPPRLSDSRRTRAWPPNSSTVSRKCPPGPIGA